MKEFIKNCDYLGERVSLNYNKRSRHGNLIGGFLTIMLGVMSIGLTIYFSLEIFIKENPRSFLVTKFTENAGKLKLDTNGILHFLYLKTGSNFSQIIKYDKRAINVTGLVIRQNNETILGTYLYDTCNYDFDFGNVKDVFTESMKDLIEQSLCPRIYINLEGKSFVNNSTNFTESGFEYPYAEFGGSSIKNIPVYYSLNIRKCTNSSLNKNSCYPVEQINEYYAEKGVDLKFVDNYFDVSNYLNPVSKFLNKVSAKIGPLTISNNYLNFLRVNVTTLDGLIFEYKKVDESYKFDYRVEIAASVSGYDEKKILQYNFMLQNMSQFYSRSYQKLQDIFANIGGIVKFLIICGNWVNYLFDKFQRHIDWEIFFEKMIIKSNTQQAESYVKSSSIINLKSNMKLDMNDIQRSNFRAKGVTDLQKESRFQIDKISLSFLQFYCNKISKQNHHIDEIKKCIEIMLDESNILKHYIETIKLKKLILVDDFMKNHFENIAVTFEDIFYSNFHEFNVR